MITAKLLESDQLLTTHRSPTTTPGRWSPISEQVLYINVQWFRGGLVFKAHRRVYHSTLGLRVVKKKKNRLKRARTGMWAP